MKWRGGRKQRRWADPARRVVTFVTLRSWPTSRLSRDRDLSHTNAFLTLSPPHINTRVTLMLSISDILRYAVVQTKTTLDHSLELAARSHSCLVIASLQILTPVCSDLVRTTGCVVCWTSLVLRSPRNRKNMYLIGKHTSARQWALSQAIDLL